MYNYQVRFPCSLLPTPCSLLPAPCSLLPVLGIIILAIKLLLTC
ncbi:hypothetical protein [Moorena producens]|nr:hypothetical protein [Moorena producens]